MPGLSLGLSAGSFLCKILGFSAFCGAGPQFLPKNPGSSGCGGTGQGPLQRFCRIPRPASRSSCLCGRSDSRHVRADRGLLTARQGWGAGHVCGTCHGCEEGRRQGGSQGIRVCGPGKAFLERRPRVQAKFSVRWAAYFSLERLCVVSPMQWFTRSRHQVYFVI